MQSRHLIRIYDTKKNNEMDGTIYYYSKCSYETTNKAKKHQTSQRSNIPISSLFATVFMRKTSLEPVF